MSRASVLLFLGSLGIAFYAAGPIVFPHVENLRQPELLPVYTLMLGLGRLEQAAKKERKKKGDDDGPKPPNKSG